ELIGGAVFDLYPLEQAQLFHEKDNLLLKKGGGHRFESQLKNAKGLYRDVIIHKAAYTDNHGEVTGLIGVILDITERKRGEEALQKSEAVLKEAQRVAHIGHWELDPDIGTPVWSDEIFHIFGLDRRDGEPSFIQHATYVHPEDWPILDKAVRRAGKDGTPFDITFRIIKPGGEMGWMHAIGTTSADAEGNVTKLFGTAQDITQIKRAEKALEESQENLSMAQKIAHIGSWKYHSKTGGAYWSDELIRIYGLDPNKAKVSLELAIDMIHPDDKKNAEEMIRKSIQDGLPYEIEYRIIRPDGEKRLLQHIGKTEKDETGDVLSVYGICQDMTEQKQAEEEHEKLQAQLLQAQKMESVGRLAGGVAHDFNNKLGVILGYVELMLTEMKPDDTHYEDLKEIHIAARDSAGLTRQLLAFARKQTIMPEVLDLNETLESMFKMLRRLIGEDIDLAWQPDTNLWAVKIDPAQVDQILANLCVNSRDAIDGVGKVSITTENVMLDEAYCAEHVGCVPADYVMLAVSDDGCGMDRETLDSAFEPFFTTKDSGRGTGLGLSMVYGIVKQNNGFIEGYSEPDQGTTFKIYLPRHKGEAETEADAIRQEVPRGQGETILVVEDETSLLKMVKKTLEQLGYTVLATENAKEAPDMVRAHSDDIHLLLTDVVMPEMSGNELAEQISDLRPNTKTLFMSGYTNIAALHHRILEEGVYFIQKPFSLDTLARKVREVIDDER
ncbi:MAG: PAS domain-containing protein, partial [Deltaproteobacteria bacterium]|nr:PAS domain-containing protein [Deltaproteobacteria bacterium]